MLCGIGGGADHNPVFTLRGLLFSKLIQQHLILIFTRFHQKERTNYVYDDWMLTGEHSGRLTHDE